MKHLMLDCYGANRDLLDDLKYITYILNEMAGELDLKTICPPQLVPYYYGKIADDDGISAFVLLEGGHITIHTFPYRECYFMDIFYDGDFSTEKLTALLHNRLAYDESISTISCRDRSVDTHDQYEYDPDKDFGPHVLIKVKMKEVLDMERVYDFLEYLVPNIDMTPITRPCVLKSRINNPKYLSGIILIAQSHISMHYNYKKQELYFDVFSCVAFDFTTLPGHLAQFGEVVSNDLVARGSKHRSNIKKDPFNSRKRGSRKWLKTIGNK